MGHLHSEGVDANVIMMIDSKISVHDGIKSACRLLRKVVGEIAVNYQLHGGEAAASDCIRKIVKLMPPNYPFPFQSMIHVSTAYANCHLRHIEEKFYDYPVNFEELDEKIDQMDDKTIDSMTSK